MLRRLRSGVGRSVADAIARASPEMGTAIFRAAGYAAPHFRTASALPRTARLATTVRTGLGVLRFHDLAPDEWAPVAAGTLEPRCINLLSSLDLDGKICFDVGASYGYYSVALARAVGSSGRVFAFEPQPDTFARLVGTIHLNGASTVTALPLALADEHGLSAWTHHPFAPWLDHLAVAQPRAVSAPVVPVTTIDGVVDAIGQPPSFIKIDVEGAAARVLRGARNVLEMARPLVLCEVDESVDEAADVRGLFVEHMYEVQVVERSPVSRLHLLAIGGGR